MNRRNFLKSIGKVVAGCVIVPSVVQSVEVAPYDFKGNSDGWKFYINGKEVDSSRVVDKLGALRFPFQGAKEGDLCTVKSPLINFRIK